MSRQYNPTKYHKPRNNWKRKYRCMTVMCPHLTYGKEYKVDQVSGVFSGDGEQILYMRDHHRLMEEAI